MAGAGIASRRKCEEFIESGLVKVNGKVAELGIRIDPEKDEVVFRGRVLEPEERKVTVMLNKPRGYICTKAKGEGESVYELLKDIPERVVSIGRLDKNSEGLLLFSNDGELVNKLTHPSFNHEKVYEVSVEGRIGNEVLKKLNGRMKIDGYMIRPAKVKILKQSDRSAKLEFILKEGRKRQIRKMCEEVGLNVRRLKRARVGNLKLGSLPVGKWRELDQEKIG